MSEELMCPICGKNTYGINKTPDCQHTFKEIIEFTNDLKSHLEEIANPSVKFLRDEFALTQPMGGILGLWVAGFTQMFIDQGAKNYIELSLRNALNASDPVEYIFHIQKRDGKTPHELRLEAEKERDALQAKLDEIVKVVQELLRQRDAINKSRETLQSRLDIAREKLSRIYYYTYDDESAESIAKDALEKTGN